MPPPNSVLSPQSSVLLDENDFCGFVAWRGLSDAYRAAVNGHTPWRPDTPHPEPICVADVYADASLAKLFPVFQSEGIGALAFFPLVYRDRVLGKFMVYYGAPHERILASGLAFHLTKPVDPVAMVRVIREAARR